MNLEDVMLSDTDQSLKDKCWMTPLLMLGNQNHRFRKQNGGYQGLVPGAGVVVHVWFNSTEFVLCTMKRVLRMGGGAGCSTKWMDLNHWPVCLKMLKMATFYVHSTTIKMGEMHTQKMYSPMFSIIYNQKVEIAQQLMNTFKIWYITYNRILSSHKKEWSINTCYSMGHFWTHYATSKETRHKSPHTEWFHLYKIPRTRLPWWFSG